MFSRKEKSREAQEKRIKFGDKIKYIGLTIISIDYLTFIVLCIYSRVNGEVFDPNYKSTTGFKTYCNISSVFFAIESLVCFAGMAWICKNLKRDPKFKGNTKWMAVHFFWLVLITVSFRWGIE
jgi:hypothetical protein